MKLCSRSWLKLRLDLVNVSQKIFKISELRMVWSSLLNWTTAERKKEFWGKLCFIFSRGILLVFYVLPVLTEVERTLSIYFGYWYLKIFKKRHSFLYRFHFSRVSKPTLLYGFSLDAPLTAPVIVSATRYWVDSSFRWNLTLYVWSYMSP